MTEDYDDNSEYHHRTMHSPSHSIEGLGNCK